MSVTLIVALVIQGATIAIMRVALGRGWLRRPATLIVAASGIYHGLSAILLSFPSVRPWDTFGRGVAQSATDDATLLMTAGMLAFAVAYLMARPGPGTIPAGPEGVRAAAQVLDWRLLALACAPLAILTYEGRGYNNAVHLDAATSTGTALASAFFVIMVLLTAFSLVLRGGPGWFVPILAGQSVLLAAAGERIPVLTDAIALGIMLAHAGIRVPRGQLRAAAALTLLTILALTGVRAGHSRVLYYKNTGVTARVIALGSGLSAAFGAAGDSQYSLGLITQAAQRLDGDSFAGAIWQSAHLGQPRLGAAYVPASLLVTVPSFAWSSKLARGDALNPAILEIDDFGLQRTNFLPTFPGLYIGMLPPPWLIAFLACCGALLGWGERALYRRCTPAQLVLLAGAVTGALRYEQGLPGMLVGFRAAAAIALAIKLIQVVRARRWGSDWVARDQAAPPPARF